MKERGEKIVMLTAYDTTSARLAEAAGIRLILVGDSLGPVMLGYESTIQVTMEDMLPHVRAVARGTKEALIVGDLPFMTYTVTEEDALRHAARMIQEGGAQAVKLEGGEIVAGTVQRLVACGLPVMGHLGLTPQSIHQLGGFKVQGRSVEAARRLLDDARRLEDAGAFSLVLECIPAPLAAAISERLTIPTIGIGAGAGCDGQVQVWHDLLGLLTDFKPKHAKRYANLGETIIAAVQQYIREVQGGEFPAAEHAFTMPAEVLAEAVAGVGG